MNERTRHPPYLPFSKIGRSTTALFALVLFAWWAAGCQLNQRHEAVAFSTEAWKYKGVEGTKIVSDHYEIYTTCKRKPFLDALPTFMEACYLEYRRVLPTAAAPTERMKTYVFLRRAEWSRFTEEFAGPRAATYKQIRHGGYSEGGVTVSFYTNQATTFSILAHEGLHQYLEITGRHLIPAWINEGLACYFEAFEIDFHNRPTFIPQNNSLRSAAMREALANDALIPLREILDTNAGIAVHKQSSHVRSYYAQEWSLVLFLLDSPLTNKYHAGFKLLLDELGTEAMHRKATALLSADTAGQLSLGEAVFRAYITDRLDAFDADYRAFLRKRLDLREF
ncbi:MAG TPA: DUF1570 domain-containing protein [Phycisphaerae bacterium]|nr:DUF1570 domain-containing protein [Phycisphaerae bacterium]